MKGSEDEENAFLRTAFLERVAHELRGPAGVIQGALQELESALGEGAQQHMPLLSLARRGVRRIVRTADRLQQTGVLERGALKPAREKCDLASLVKRASQEAETVEGRKKITLSIELPDGPQLCQLDVRWMSIAFYELASNAIRHARAKVQVRLTQTGDVFEVLFIDDNSSSTKFSPSRFRSSHEIRGLGLALSIVSDVVVAHGGTLDIEAGQEAGGAQGARVRVRIPQTAPPLIAEQATAP